MDSRNAVSKVYSVLKEAAEESLGKLVCGQGKRKTHSWWDEEVKEAIKRRKQACREHRKCRNLHERFQTW